MTVVYSSFNRIKILMPKWTSTEFGIIRIFTYEKQHQSENCTNWIRIYVILPWIYVKKKLKRIILGGLFCVTYCPFVHWQEKWWGTESILFKAPTSGRFLDSCIGVRTVSHIFNSILWKAIRMFLFNDWEIGLKLLLWTNRFLFFTISPASACISGYLRR